MNALLLSAGLGTRFQPTTLKVPKPALPFLNVPLMAYSLYYIEKLGLKNLVLNTHHLPQKIESITSCLTHQQPYSVQFSYEPKILGSGGGIKNASSLLSTKDDFIVCNADEVMLFNHDEGFGRLMDFHRRNGALATLLTTSHPEAGRSLGGVWADSSGVIRKLGGLGAEPGAQHFAGPFVFSPRIFDFMPSGEFHIFKDCLHKAMAQGEKVLAFHDPALTWLEMTAEKDYVASTEIALRILAEEHEDSVSINLRNQDLKIKAGNLKNILKRFHQSIETVGPRQWLCPGAKFAGSLNEGAFLFMGPDSEIMTDVEVKGFAVLGAGARFTQGVIERTAIAPHVHIHGITAIRNQLIV